MPCKLDLNNEKEPMYIISGKLLSTKLDEKKQKSVANVHIPKRTYFFKK